MSVGQPVPPELFVGSPRGMLCHHHQSHGSQNQLLFELHFVFFLSEASQCIQGNSMPKSRILKSDVARIQFRFSMHPRGLHAKLMYSKIRFYYQFFLELLNVSIGDPCQSNGFQIQILFVFHFVFLWIASMYLKSSMPK